jgi:hypothetical protein
VPNKLKSWPRPHFTPGGGNPLLFYRVFGEFDLSRPLSRAKYRASGQPEWLELTSNDRVKQPELFVGHHSGPLWEMMTRDSPLTANEAERAPQCVVVRGEVTDPSTLDYFRDAIGVLTWLLDAGGAVIYDPQMLWLWSADEWREEAFEPGDPNPDRHTVILVSGEPTGTSWYHTRGMRKFGRPDLSIRGVGTKYAEGVSTLIERFVEYQAFGGVIPEGETVRIKVLPPGGICRHAGTPDDPDFNNVHVEIEWPGSGLK